MNNLIKLAALLDTVPPERFDLNYWQRTLKLADPTCNTTACAIGWACLSNEFPGLAMSRANDGWVPAPVWLNADGHVLAVSWAAVYGYFDIPETIALWLFSEDSYREHYRTAICVAHRIRVYCEAPLKFNNVPLRALCEGSRYINIV